MKRFSFVLAALLLMLCVANAALAASTLTLPDDLKEIEAETFKSARGFDTVILPEGLERIGEDAFADSTLLQIVIPRSVTNIAESAFHDIPSIATISVYEGSYAQTFFEGIDHDYDVNVIIDASDEEREDTDWSDFECDVQSDGADGVIVHVKDYIGQRPQGTALRFPEEYAGKTVTDLYIDDGAFKNCTTQFDPEITLPDNLREIGDHAFENMVSPLEYDHYILNIPGSVRRVGAYAFYGEVVQSVTFGEGVDEIGEHAFADDKYLMTADLPASLRFLADTAFENPHEYFWTTRAYRESPDGFQYYLNNYAAYIVSYQGSAETLTVPAALEDWAVTRVDSFEGCETLKSVTFPDQKIELGEGVFRDCATLETVHLPAGLETIPQYAFQNCTSLKEFDVPDTVTAIGSSAFSGCESLTRISLPEGLVQTGDFDGCAKLRSISLPSTVQILGSFTGCESLKSIMIPEGVEYIQAYAFSGCESLKSVYLPKTITAIGSEAFKKCSALEEIDLQGVVSIGEGAFWKCSALKSVTFHEGLEEIGPGAFTSCKKLTQAVLPDGVTLVGRDAFSDCPLKIYAIPDTAAQFYGEMSVPGMTVYANPGSAAYEAFVNIGITPLPYSNFSSFTNFSGKPYGLPSGQLKLGEAFKFSGMYDVDETILGITANISSNSGIVQSFESEPDAAYFAYSTLNDTLHIEELPLGEYTFTMQALLESDPDNWQTIARTAFEIISSVPGLHMSADAKLPMGMYRKGEPFEAKGLVRANRVIEKIHVEVTDANNGDWLRDYDLEPNAYSVQMSDVLENLGMERLDEGYYAFRMWVTLEGVTYQSEESLFRVYYYDGIMDEALSRKIILWCEDPENLRKIESYNDYMDYLSNMDWSDQVVMFISNGKDILVHNTVGHLLGVGDMGYVKDLYKNTLLEMMGALDPAAKPDSLELPSFVDFVKKTSKNVSAMGSMTTEAFIQSMEEYIYQLQHEEGAGVANLVVANIYQADVAYMKEMKGRFSKLGKGLKITGYAKDVLDLFFTSQANYQNGLLLLATFADACGDHPPQEFKLALEEIISEYQDSGRATLNKLFDELRLKIWEKAYDEIEDGILTFVDKAGNLWEGTASLDYSIITFALGKLENEILHFDDIADNDYAFLANMNLMLEARSALDDAVYAVNDGDTSSSRLNQVMCCFEVCRYATAKLYDVMADCIKSAAPVRAESLRNMGEIVNAIPFP